MYGKPTSIDYTIEVVDIPIYLKERSNYKSTVKINLKLTYQNPPIPKDGKFIFTIPISALTPEGVSINTIKRMIDSVSSSQCSNNDILYYFDKEILIITINHSSIISENPITLDISYKTPVNTPILVDKKTRLCDTLKEFWRFPQYYRRFVIPIYDEIENDCITYNIILPSGWKVEYGRYYHNKHHHSRGYETIWMNCIEKKIHAVRRYKVNNFKSKRRPCFEYVVLIVEPKDLYYEDKFKNAPFYHNWEFNKNNRSVWNLIIYKKQLQHYMHNNGGVKALSFGFAMVAGSKNTLIVSLSYILLFFSILFTTIYLHTLLGIGICGPTLLCICGCTNDINYIDYIFADIGLLTVIFAYFFSYFSLKNNGLMLCIAPERIELNLIISIGLALLCAVALIEIAVPILVLKIVGIIIFLIYLYFVIKWVISTVNKCFR